MNQLDEIRDAIQDEIDTGLGTEGELLVKTIVTRLSDITIILSRRVTRSS